MKEKNKKALIVSSYCFQNATANGICARALFDAFGEKGIETHILGIGGDEGLSQYEHAVPDTVKKTPRFKKIAAVLRLLKSIFVPVQDTKRIRSYYAQLKALDEKYKFDVVVAMYFPLELVSAAAKLKKKSPDISFVIYELDSVADGIGGNRKGLLKKLSAKSNIRWSKKHYAAADLICVLQGHETHVRQMYGKTYEDKIKIVDLPLLKDNVLAPGTHDTGDVSFVYAGELNSWYRPPHKLLDVMEQTQAYSNWHFHFYSKGDCEDVLRARSLKDPRIHCHGYVAAEVLHRQYETTDCFISIGNTHSNSVPSKIIHYISLGRPIIHFCLQENDICEAYLRKYPLALIIQRNEAAEEAAKKIAEFVALTQGRTVEFEVLQKSFPLNLPAYSVEEIMSNLNSERT